MQPGPAIRNSDTGASTNAAAIGTRADATRRSDAERAGSQRRGAITELLRTIVDRTVDAARGRFDF